MAITPANYAAWITQVDTTIGHIYSQMDPRFNAREIATELPMSGSIWNAGWTGRMPKARPWFGPRVVHEPAAQTYQVAPIPYELTYGIDRFILDDSDVNSESIFWRTLPDMAMQWRRWEVYETRDLLEGTGVQAGTNGVGGNRQNGLDGLRAFSTAHPINIYLPSFNGGGNALFAGGTYCNDFTGGGVTINGTLIGGALGQTSFSSLLQYIQVIPDESGEALGVMPDVMLVPSTLQIEANFILTAAFLASPVWGAFSPLTGQVGTADNMLRKVGVRPLVHPFLRNTTRWYLLDTSHAIKPFLWVRREAPRTVPRVTENDPIVFDLHKYLWGGWARGTPAWNYSWLFFRSGP
jgi:phage major head subunit gpT-like protein